MTNWEQPQQPPSSEKVLTAVERLKKIQDLAGLFERLIKAKQELKLAYEAGEETGSYDDDKIKQLQEQKDNLESEIGLIVGDYINYEDDIEEVERAAVTDIYDNGSEEVPEIKLDDEDISGIRIKIFPNGMAILRDARPSLNNEPNEYRLFNSEEAKDFIQNRIKDDEEGIRSTQTRIENLSGILRGM